MPPERRSVRIVKAVLHWRGRTPSLLAVLLFVGVYPFAELTAVILRYRTQWPEALSIGSAVAEIVLIWASFLLYVFAVVIAYYAGTRPSSASRR